MPPPLFLIFIPSVALVFLIQILICHAYHFQVTLARHRKRSISPNAENNKPDSDKKQTSPHRKGTLDSQDKTGMGDRPEDSSRRTGGDSCTLPEGEGRTRSAVGFDIPEAKSSGSEQNYLSENRGTQNSLRARRKSVFAESYDPAKDKDDVKVVHPKTEVEKKWLRDHLKTITLFKLCLANDQVETVVDAMYKFPAKQGDLLMKEGDRGNTFFVVQEGKYDVYVKDQSSDVDRLVHTYDNEGSFGELALLYNQPRAATIIAREDGVLWAVDGQTFRRIVYKITYQKRQMYESLINNVDILRALTAFERANLVDALVPVTYEHGQEIFHQGDEADGMYFIVSGGVRVMCQLSTGEEKLLKELSNSDYFGELALVTDNARAASVYSVGQSHLAFLSRESFERLLGPCMDVMRRNIQDYSERMSEITHRRKSSGDDD